MSQASDFRLQKNQKKKEWKEKNSGNNVNYWKRKEEWKLTENEEKKPIIKSPTKSVNLNGQIC